ncbi:MAG: SRPBCC family protein [Wenzhouxiangellaceae bacterium]
MRLDIERHLGAVERSVAVVERDGREARAVTLVRSYATDIDDLWEALTSAERLPRWFLPVEGDLQPGGRFQLQGNAGGSITVCEPPERLDLTWEFGDYPTSWVEVRLTPEDSNRTRLTLCHIAHPDQFWDDYGPGAAGIGWELGLIGLDAHLTDPGRGFDESEVSASPEGKALIRASSDGWAEADIATGADPAAARAAGKRTYDFYTGQSGDGD